MPVHPAQREVECPSCGHCQSEPAGIIGTICVACRESFPVKPLDEARKRRESGYWGRTLGGAVGEAWTAVRRGWRRQPAAEHLRSRRVLATPFQIVEDGLACADLGLGQTVAPGRRQVACPYCQAPAELPMRALSHACPECGRHFPLRDHDIDGEVQANLATAGGVVVHHRGRLVAASVRCGELVVRGQATGAFTVTGRAEYFGRGETIGELHCGHLVLARGARRTFHQRIFALAADIHGELTGDICCAGRVHISRGGAVDGSVLAGHILLDAGGRLNGSMATLTAVLRPDARLTGTAREMRHNFGQEAGDAPPRQ